MDGYDAATYGDRFADVYDAWYPGDEASGDAVTLLRELAEDGAALELGCGTGRLLLPLAAAGVPCVGIDSSAAMLARLQVNAEAQEANAARKLDVRAHIADMARFSLDTDDFSLCFVAFNTLFNVSTTAARHECFVSVAKHLRPGGRFVVECFVPPERHDKEEIEATQHEATQHEATQHEATQHDAVEVRDLSADRVVLRISRHDPVDQTITGQHIELTDGGVRLRPWHLRYATADELDAQATAAGFELESRLADWRSTPFTDQSTNHVSVYRLPSGTDERADEGERQLPRTTQTDLKPTDEPDRLPWGSDRATSPEPGGPFRGKPHVQEVRS